VITLSSSNINELSLKFYKHELAWRTKFEVLVLCKLFAIPVSFGMEEACPPISDPRRGRVKLLKMPTLSVLLLPVCDMLTITRCCQLWIEENYSLFKFRYRSVL
jgi:hypothetical protein